MTNTVKLLFMFLMFNCSLFASDINLVDKLNMNCRDYHRWKKEVNSRQEILQKCLTLDEQEQIYKEICSKVYTEDRVRVIPLSSVILSKNIIRDTKEVVYTFHYNYEGASFVYAPVWSPSMGYTSAPSYSTYGGFGSLDQQGGNYPALNVNINNSNLNSNSNLNWNKTNSQNSNLNKGVRK